MQHVDPDQLALLALGEQVHPGEDAELTAHLVGCLECQREFRSLRATVELARETVGHRDEPIAPPPGVWSGIVAELGLDGSAPPQPRFGPDAGPRRTYGLDGTDGSFSAGDLGTGRPPGHGGGRHRWFGDPLEDPDAGAGDGPTSGGHASGGLTGGGPGGGSLRGPGHVGHGPGDGTGGASRPPVNGSRRPADSWPGGIEPFGPHGEAGSGPARDDGPGGWSAPRDGGETGRRFGAWPGSAGAPEGGGQPGHPGVAGSGGHVGETGLPDAGEYAGRPGSHGVAGHGGHGWQPGSPAGSGRPERTPDPATSPGGGAEAIGRTPGERRAARRWQRMAALTAAAAVGVLGTVAVTQPWRDEPTAVQAAAAATLAPVRGGPVGAHGEVTLLRTATGSKLQITASGLPAPSGFYQVWVYDGKARMLAVGVLGPDQRATVPLPATLDLHTFHVVDISAEPYDGDQTHSSESVLRGSLDG